MAHEQTQLKLGVVGFGKLGLLHAGLANALPDCKLVAVADPHSTTLKFLKGQMPSVSTFESHQDLIRSLPLDGVFIAAPTHLHAPIAMDFIRAKVPVFIEKPLSLTAAQAKPLVDVLSTDSVVNMVGYMNRFSDIFRRAKSIIASGALGRLQTCRSTMYISQLFKAGKGWRYDKATSGGGVLITQNSHLLDLLYWMFGDVEWVSGHTRRLYSKEVEDSVHAVLQFKSGLTSWIDTSWSVRHHRTLTMNIFVEGENGTLEFNDDEVKLFLENASDSFKSGWTRWKKPDVFEGVSFDLGGPHYTRQSEQFVNAIRGRATIESDVASAYVTQLLVDAIYASADQRGAPVNITPITTKGVQR